MQRFSVYPFTTWQLWPNLATPSPGEAVRGGGEPAPQQCVWERLHPEGAQLHGLAAAGGDARAERHDELPGGAGLPLPPAPTQCGGRHHLRRASAPRPGQQWVVFALRA